MSSRLQMVSKIKRITAHQKEVIELRLREVAQRRALEMARLTILKKELQGNIDRFEKGLIDSFILSSDEVAFLFGLAGNFFQKIEGKRKEIEGIEKEWETLQAVFLEAYKKKKAVEIVQQKIRTQEKKAEAVLEQRDLDYLTLLSRSRP